MELEAKLSTLQDTTLKGAGVNGSGNSSDSRQIPKGPARATLCGHRAPVTSVAVHPIYR